MTALKKYQRLESPGLWRETPEAQRREVIVAFGDTSLVLSDPRTAIALSHWSLPAVRRINPGATPAIYAPDETELETLEIEDATMTGAIETVRGAVARARARPGRLRSVLWGGGALILGAVVVFWLPEALIAQTAAMVPMAKRVEIGRMALADVTKLTGLPCAEPLGVEAAAQLSQRVLGAGGGQILIVPEGVTQAASLPGELILLNRAVVEQADGPEVAAGFALAERSRALAQDPLVPLLEHAGLLSTVRLLTTGFLPEGAVDGYAREFLVTPPAPLPDEPLLAVFEAAGVSSAPYAYALDPTGETTLGLIEADPMRGKTPTPLLPDGDWISLQAICQG